jgi:hypothetical protein
MYKEPTTNQKLNDRFFNDPEWRNVEEMILSYINPLIEMSNVDTTQSADTVKAEVIGRKLAYDSLMKFLSDTKFVSRNLTENNNNIFK